MCYTERHVSAEFIAYKNLYLYYVVYNTLEDTYLRAMSVEDARGCGGRRYREISLVADGTSSEGLEKTEGGLGFSPRGPVVAPNSVHTHTHIYIYIHYIKMIVLQQPYIIWRWWVGGARALTTIREILRTTAAAVEERSQRAFNIYILYIP